MTHYNTKKGAWARRILLVAVILGVAVYAAAEVRAMASAGPEPDTVFPMANTHVSWSQTFHAGSWGE